MIRNQDVFVLRWGQREFIRKHIKENGHPWERITYFNENGKYKASNPVISDDGKFMAFQVPRLDEVAGVGHGIYILDIEKYEEANLRKTKKR